MTPESAPIRLVIVEDDEHLLASLAKIMASQPDIRVVGAYASTEEAMEQTDWSAADVLLADLGLPGVSGVDLIAAATFQNPQLYALVHTIHDDRQSLFAALRAGAIGYVIKGLPALETIDAVRAVSQGTSSLSPSIAHFLIEEFHSRSAASADEALTPREVELLSLSAQGLLYKEIGERLSISAGTVHSHIKRIYRKLQASGREQALRRAQALGYLKTKNTD
ncbi:MAG: response regulator transcription factor [Verrucomicrobia bacterium]|nr:MAG: response regulator transcription factor [Verrucomicrobiota bacterium]